MANLIPFNRRRADIMSTGFEGFQNMLDDFFADGWPMRRSLAGDTFKIDVKEDKDEYVIEAELPGVEKDAINIRLDEGKLVVAVNKEESSEENTKNYIHRERRYSSMSRTIFLGDADAASIKAKLENGILCITVPKKVKQDTTINVEIE